MSLFKDIIHNIKTGVKDSLFSIMVRKHPVIIRDVQYDILQDKNVILTGGNSGIGYAIAKKFIQCGASVTIIGSNRNKTEQVAKELQCSYIIADLGNIPDTIETVSLYIQDKHIDILVNSAGILDKEPWLDKTPEMFERIIKINLEAPYFLSQTIAKHMLEKRIKGHILNISSSSSMRPSWGPYQLSKRALNGMTLGFAHRLAANGITVNGIAPGVTATPMMDKVLKNSNLAYPNPMRRAETPEEIANLAVFMVSDLGNSIIGDTVMMTGGSGNLSIDY